MAATTPQSTSLIKQLQREYPAFTFRQGDAFYWSPHQKTIYYTPLRTVEDTLSLLHELAHAVLNHRSFETAIELLDMERDAWTQALTVFAPRFLSSYSADELREVAETALDEYRDWLHKRSTCPHCSATGVETSPHQFRCLVCRGSWHVNDARSCALRRYKQP